MKADRKDEYAVFRFKLLRRVCCSIALSTLIVAALYLLVWKRRMGDLVVWGLETIFRMDPVEAYYFYSDHFRGNKDLFFCGAVLLVFCVLLWRVLRGITRCFNEINQGIDILLADDGAQIQLSPEMLPFERKLNAVKQTLEQRKADTALAEQRKDELVMYLAHDIRTPLTSIIGYLNLLEEAPGMPAAQRAKNVRIALDKAYRLEEMIHEFFEITRYNSQQIKLAKAPVDLCLLLAQLSDELSPVFSGRGNSIVLDAGENLTLCADADQLARVFGNILKNAAAYSDPETEIRISAEKAGDRIHIAIQNKGASIPAEKLPALFDKFYRMDAARVSDTGGAGLGLAIAKEIVLLHGGSIRASSENGSITFTVTLPAADQD